MLSAKAGPTAGSGAAVSVVIPTWNEAAELPETLRRLHAVTGVREIRKAGQGTGLGAVAGGVLGGVLGRSVGGGNHRTAGTVVGAAGGAVAGHMIEKKTREGHLYEIGVRFDDGHSRVFTLETHPSLQQGSRIRVVNGALTPL